MIGAAYNAKHIRCLIWVETNVVEVHTMITGLDENESWDIWRIVYLRNRSQYELRHMMDDRFERLPESYSSLEEALLEIEDRETAADEDADRYRGQVA